MIKWNPSTESLQEYLIRFSKTIGHYAFAKWAKKNGISFKYTYFILFGIKREV